MTKMPRVGIALVALGLAVAVVSLTEIGLVSAQCPPSTGGAANSCVSAIPIYLRLIGLAILSAGAGLWIWGTRLAIAESSL